MRYCPKCSAYQHDDAAVSCRKCGFDFSEHLKKMKEEEEQRSAEQASPPKKVAAPLEPDHPCPICGAPTRAVETTVESAVQGNKIVVQGVRLMGSEISKRSVTECQIDVVGRACENGHKIYATMVPRVRAVCPLCLHYMINYGSAVLSCTKCNKHFSLDDWVFPGPEEVLRNEGWIKR